MRFVELARALAVLSVLGLLSGCPKNDSNAAPEPASTAAQPASDKAGAEAPVAAPAAEPAAKKKKDDGGW